MRKLIGHGSRLISPTVLLLSTRIAVVVILILIALALTGLFDRAVRISSGEIEPVGGYAYAFRYEPSWAAKYAYSVDSNKMGRSGLVRRSGLVLSEDGAPLPLPHSYHDGIKQLGLGRYSHWHKQILFSTTDNSDPRSNGRDYTLVQKPKVNALLLALVIALTSLALVWTRGLVRPLGAMPEVATVQRLLLLFRPAVRYLLVLLVLACAVFIASSLEVEKEGPQKDPKTYATLGLALSQTASYELSSEKPGYSRRPPLYPALIALANLARGAAGLEMVPVYCASSSRAASPECFWPLTSLKLVNVFLLILAGLGGAYLVKSLSGSRIAAGLAFFLIVFSGQMLSFVSFFWTEVVGATLMLAVGLFSWLSLTRVGTLYFIALGASLALLVLTKVIFAYIWIAYAAILIAAAMLRKSQRRQIGRGLLVFLGVYGVIIGGWSIRNYVQTGHLEIVSSRGPATVLTMRAVYNNMTDAEFWNAFVYYTPALGKKALLRWNVPKEDYERLSLHATGATLRNLGRSRFHELIDKYVRDGNTKSEATERITREAIEQIMAHPVKHIRASVGLAYRAMFTEIHLGLYCVDEDTWIRWGRSLRISQLWGASWLCWGKVFTPEWVTVYGAVGFAALLLLPFVYGLQHGAYAMVACIGLVMPALYAHAMYAAASHFIPRYAVSEIPLRVVSICILLGLALHGLTKAWDAWSGRIKIADAV